MILCLLKDWSVSGLNFWIFCKETRGTFFVVNKSIRKTLVRK